MFWKTCVFSRQIRQIKDMSESSMFLYGMFWIPQNVLGHPMCDRCICFYFVAAEECVWKNGMREMRITVRFAK